MTIRKFTLASIGLSILAVALLAVVTYVEFAHHYNYGHFVSFGLHVDVVNEDSNIGIPGQTKLYRAELSNYSLIPVRLTGCAYTSDTLTPGVDYLYLVQRWEASANDWQIVANLADNICHPIPAGRGSTHIVFTRLWPGESVQVMDFEATGARDPFRKGDFARFVVLRKIGATIDSGDAIASAAFRIEDEVERNDINYRVKH